jgi:uncharacterized protein
MIQRQTSLSENIISFCRFLRQNDFTIGFEEEATALQALSFIPFQDSLQFKMCLMVTLCRDFRQLSKYDSLHHQYWKELEQAVDSKTKDSSDKNRSKTQQPSLQSLKSWLYGNQPQEEVQTAIHSAGEVLVEQDFSTIPEDQIEELSERIREMAKWLANRVNRRHQKSNAQKVFDLKNTLRKNMRNGGELVNIEYKKPKKNKIKLILLCDVSKSMELYSIFLLQFMYAFQSVFKHIETFTFGTSLQKITKELQQNSFRKTLDDLSTSAQNWSGGTQIGKSLSTFVENFGIQLLNKNTIVIVMSDGWDTGDLEILEESMRKIQQKSKKIIWLNPLAGSPNFEAKSQGMQVAMPFVDIFAPVHNILSLRNLANFLK